MPFAGEVANVIVKALRPRSIVHLILLAFVVVTLPLTAGLLTATFSVRQLGHQGQQAVRTAAATVRYSRSMVELLTNMERSARQFSVLHDASLYRLYVNRHQDFVRTGAAFARLSLSASMRGQLNALRAGEVAVFRGFDGKTPDSKASTAALARFRGLGVAARALLGDSTQSIATEVNRVQSAAARLQRRLVWTAAALIPAAMLLAILSIFLISRPIRAVDRAIKRLGNGDFVHPVAVHGPQDLIELGERLDWLRVRLADLEQHRVRLLQHISHQLKAPLTAVREGAQFIHDEAAGPLNAAQRKAVERLRESSVQLQKSVEDLLDFGTLPEPVGSARQPVPIDQVVTRVVAEQRAAIKAKGLTVVPDLAPTTVVADPERVRLVVENLFSNAIKYSPRGGVIRMHLRAEQGRITLDVCDQGPGVEPAERERIFDAFYQGRPPPSAGQAVGAGLGLAIVREYLRAYRGTIEIVDAAVGAHFRVTLPLGET